jgi:hypothetical protein
VNQNIETALLALAKRRAPHRKTTASTGPSDNNVKIDSFLHLGNIVVRCSCGSNTSNNN